MMVLVIVLVFYAVYGFLDFRQAAQRKRPGIFWPCLAIYCLGLAVQAMYELHVKVPSPMEPISGLVSSMFNLR